MNGLKSDIELPYPRFTDRARDAMVRANRLSAQRRYEDVGGLIMTVAAIESDVRIRNALPQLLFDTNALLDTLQDVAHDDHGGTAKSIVLGAVKIAEPSKSPIDTLHMLKSAMTNPSPPIVAMLSALGVTAAIVLQTADELLANR